MTCSYGALCHKGAGDNKQPGCGDDAPSRRCLSVDMYPASGTNRNYRSASACRSSLSAGS